MTIEELKTLRESEDKIEFKEAQKNYPFNGGSHREQTERRKCFLGYIVAFANEGGGHLVLGMTDKPPRKVLGTDFGKGQIGALVDQVYNHLGIRVRLEELYEGDLRVLVTKVPSRPAGKTLKFEGVALMRTGESLRNMSDEEMFAILSEQEPDFSAKVVDGLTVGQLDPIAISLLKNSYAKKQQNPAFISLPAPQILSDLNLLAGGKLNYAALLLLGQKDVISRHLPQARIIWEFRYSDAHIPYDQREVHCGPIYTMVDTIWHLINSHNSNDTVETGFYIFNRGALNEMVIREAVLNAIAHRDYTITSEILIKQYPKKLTISNPGGFPKGVNLENLLTVNSTPRSRVMVEVLEKTGLVERSGQGVDKIFSFTLAEGKPAPDYTRSDNFQVTLNLDGAVIDSAFSTFLNQARESVNLNVEEIIALYCVKNGNTIGLQPLVLEKLAKDGLIVTAKTTPVQYSLPQQYLKLAQLEKNIGNRYVVSELEAILIALQGHSFKMGELETALEGQLNRNQIKYLINKLWEDGVIVSKGTGRGTTYGIIGRWSLLRGDELIGETVSHLRIKYK